jgi:uncharacterized protein (DUF1800 family)
MSAEEKKEIVKLSKEGVKTLNLAWLNEMNQRDAKLSFCFVSTAFLQEKMAKNFFWHDHFACGDNNPVFMTSYCNVLRENALGNFRNLLFGVSNSKVPP